MNNSERERLQRGIEELGYTATSAQLDTLLRYLDALEETNRSFNLTRISREDFVPLHLLDSLTALQAITTKQPLSIIDVGTGAGFPGVPLASLLPSCTVTLLDATAKKVKFAAFTAEASGIANCRGLHGRAEALARTKEHRDRYDVAISRAVAAFPKLIEWLLPLTKVGGCAIAMKGSGYEGEMVGCEGLVRELGGEVDDIVTTPLPGTEITRYSIVVRKLRPTPPKFPR